MTFDIDWPHGHTDDYNGFTAELLTKNARWDNKDISIWILKHPNGIENLIYKVQKDGRILGSGMRIINKPAPKKKAWVVTYKVKNANDPGPFAMVYKTEEKYRASALYPLHRNHYEVLDVHIVEYED